MTKRESQVSQTKLGVSFEQWMRRPVYKVQCFTAALAYELCGIRKAPGQGYVSVLGAKNAGLSKFRCIAPYRDNEANDLRLRVARHVKAMRREAALMC